MDNSLKPIEKKYLQGKVRRATEGMEGWHKHGGSSVRACEWEAIVCTEGGGNDRDRDRKVELERDDRAFSST